jgi:dipeptidyl-peptidase-4
VILSETSPHWVDLTDDFKPLANGDFLWTSEKSGFRHIYLHKADGELVRQVTSGDWPVEQIDGVDEATSTVIFGAVKDTPLEERIYSVSYAKPGQPKALTSAGGQWIVTVAEKGGAFAGTYNDPKTPPQTALYRADGTRVRWIEENALKAGHPFWPYVDRLREPTFGTIKAADGQALHWSMRTPPGFDRRRSIPPSSRSTAGPAARWCRRPGWRRRTRSCSTPATSSSARQPRHAAPLGGLQDRHRPAHGPAGGRRPDRRRPLPAEPAVRGQGPPRRHRLVLWRLHDPAHAHRPR